MSTVAEGPPGVTLPSRPGGRSGFLADVIVELDLAGRDAVDRATAESRLKGATLATVLVENGTLNERELARAVAERHGLAMIDLETFPVEPEAAALVGGRPPAATAWPPLASPPTAACCSPWLTRATPSLGTTLR